MQPRNVFDWRRLCGRCRRALHRQQPWHRAARALPLCHHGRAAGTGRSARLPNNRPALGQRMRAARRGSQPYLHRPHPSRDDGLHRPGPEHPRHSARLPARATPHASASCCINSKGTPQGKSVHLSSTCSTNARAAPHQQSGLEASSSAYARAGWCPQLTARLALFCSYLPPHFSPLGQLV